jgi:hypothetical protein
MTPAMAQDGFVLDDIVFSVRPDTAQEAARAGVTVDVLDRAKTCAFRAKYFNCSTSLATRPGRQLQPAMGHPGPARPCASAGRGKA